MTNSSEEIMRVIVSHYLDGQVPLPKTFFEIDQSFYVVRVGFLDKRPQNRFRFNIFTRQGTYSLKDQLTRVNIDLAFDLAVLIYFKLASPRKPSEPGYILGWYGDRLATTVHHYDVVKERYEELLQLHPELRKFTARVV